MPKQAAMEGKGQTQTLREFLAAVSAGGGRSHGQYQTLYGEDQALSPVGAVQAESSAPQVDGSASRATGQV
jgi:hypothetical protein